MMIVEQPLVAIPMSTVALALITSNALYRFESMRKGGKNPWSLWKQRVVTLAFCVVLSSIVWFLGNSCPLPIAFGAIFIIGSARYPAPCARQVQLLGMLSLALVFLLSAAVVASREAYEQYTVQMQHQHNYEGIMRVTSVSAGAISKSNDSNIWRGKVEVAFGGEWACPDAPDTRCIATLWDPSNRCDVYNCQGGEDECTIEHMAREKLQTQHCMDKRFPNYQPWVDLVQHKNSSEDFATAPIKHAGWPTIALMGDCSTCEVQPLPPMRERPKSITTFLSFALVSVLVMGARYLWT
mmetsp:Transcript_22596/g.37375  ORF Transcript_22596/g.37375 Transcript_22596/m.37375 type:complete len:296 (+) Transcript_22596:47-934(+)